MITIQTNHPHSKLKFCQYCDKYFIYNHNRQVYCNDECKKYARQDQWRDSKRKNRKKSYNRRASELQLGSKGTIGSKPKTNFEEEAIQVHKELLRVQGKNMTRTEYAVTLKQVKEALQ